MLSATETLSAFTIKGLVVEQGRFLKKSNKLGVASFNEIANCKFLYWNYELQITSEMET